MRRYAPLGWAVSLLALAALVVHGGCRSAASADERLPKECENGTCIRVDGDDDVQALAVRQGALHVRGSASCEIVVRRLDYEVRAQMLPGDVTVADGLLLELLTCHSEPEPNRDRTRAHAVFRVNPLAFAWATPAKADLFIPYSWSHAASETAILDHQYLARAQPAPKGDPSASTEVSLFVDQSKPGVFLSGLRVGDTFTWGPHTARIVRIVPASTPLTGWVEVALDP
jgi:hypothetical protein